MMKMRKLSQLFGLLAALLRWRRFCSCFPDSLSPRTCAYKAGCWMSWEKV